MANVKNTAKEIVGGNKIRVVVHAVVHEKEIGHLRFIEPARIPNEKGRPNITFGQFSKYNNGDELIVTIDIEGTKFTPVKHFLYDNKSEDFSLVVHKNGLTDEAVYDAINSVYAGQKKKITKAGEENLIKSIPTSDNFLLLKDVNQYEIAKMAAEFEKYGLTTSTNGPLDIVNDVVDVDELLYDNSKKAKNKTMPPMIGSYQLPKVVRAFAAEVLPNVFQMGHRLNVLLKGMSGTGKTSFPQAMGEYYDKEVVMVNCQVMTNPRHWFGKNQIVTDPETGLTRTEFVLSEFAEKIMEGNKIVILDEINRLEAGHTNTLLTLLDHNGQVRLEDVRVTIKLGKGLVFFATLNEGIGFTGVMDQMDEALKNRFPITFEFKNLNNTQEKVLLKKLYKDAPNWSDAEAENLLEVIKRLREYIEKEKINIDVSARPLVNMGNLLFNYNWSLSEVVYHALVINIKIPELRKAASEIIKRVTMVKTLDSELVD